MNRDFAGGESERRPQTSDQISSHRSLWRAAFVSFGNAALRLHRLREVRMDLLNNALEKLEYKDTDE